MPVRGIERTDLILNGLSKDLEAATHTLKKTTPSNLSMSIQLTFLFSTLREKKIHIMVLPHPDNDSGLTLYLNKFLFLK